MKTTINIEKVINGYIIDVNNVKSVAKDLQDVKNCMGELFKTFVDRKGDNINNCTLVLTCIETLNDEQNS